MVTRAVAVYGRRAVKPRDCLANACMLAAMTAALSGCVVPAHMHVTEGSRPENLDTEVRFRTTYYFRVFDYCWRGDVKWGTDKPDSYRLIVPETDTLYRYRMTGKASALATKIRFESGTIRASDIDPFGTQLIYSDDIGGFYRRSEADARAAIRAADAERTSAARARDHDAIPARVAELTKLLESIKAGTIDEVSKTDLTQKLTAAIQTLLTTYATAPGGSEAGTGQRSEELLAKLADDVRAKIASMPATTAKEVGDKLEALGKVDKAANFASLCPPGAIRKKGFTIMGPEGLRDYDQDERLILAMHTSAKPLTQTLQEYSGRLLQARVNPAERLLPLTEETLRVVETQRRLDLLAPEAARASAGTGGGPSIEEVFDAAANAFDPPGRPR